MRKNLLERVKGIFLLLENSDDYVHKTNFREVGLDSQSAEQWIKIIEFIQDQPKVLVQRLGNYTAVKLTKGQNDKTEKKTGDDNKGSSPQT